MIRRIVILTAAMPLLLWGIDFETFKKEVLAHSKILHAKALSLQMQMQKNRILLRSANPELGLEAGSYRPDGEDTSLGYAVDIRQRVRRGSFMKGLSMKADAAQLLAEAYYAEGREGYLKRLEELYTHYVYSVKRVALLEQESKLLGRVARMVYARYRSGSDAKVSWLKAKSEADALDAQIVRARAGKEAFYHQMLALAGMTKPISMDAAFLYPVEVGKHQNDDLSPKERIIQARERLLQSEKRLYTDTFQSFDIVGGVEQEPDQTIGRVGVAIPLTLFNTQKEERALAKMKLAQARLQNEQLAIETEAQKSIRLQTIEALAARYRMLAKLQREQQELAQLLQEGYRIAKVSLFELMRAKRTLLETRTSLLQTRKESNLKTIELRYLEGKKND